MTKYIQGGKIFFSSIIQNSPTQATTIEIHTEILNPSLISSTLQRAVKFYDFAHYYKYKKL